MKLQEVPAGANLPRSVDASSKDTTVSAGNELLVLGTGPAFAKLMEVMRPFHRVFMLQLLLQ